LKKGISFALTVNLCLGLLLVMMTVFAACAQPAPAAKPAAPATPAPAPAPSGPIKIGVLIAKTGSFAATGEEFNKGFNLKLEQVGYKVAGRSIEVVADDEGVDPAAAMDKTRKMVESDKINILVGPINGILQLPLFPYTAKNKIPVIVPLQGGSQQTFIPYIYQPGQTVTSDSRPLGWFAYDEMKFRTASTMCNDWIAGKQFNDGFKMAFIERGGTIVQEQWPPLGTQDYSSYIVAMKQADCMPFMMNPGETGAFLNQAAEMKLLDKMPAMQMGTTLMPQMLPGLGPKVAGKIWGCHPYSLDYDGAVNKKFIADYTAKYGMGPGGFAARGYGRAQVVLAMFEATKGDTDPDKLHEAIKGLKTETPMGNVAFTPGLPDKSGVQGIGSRYIEDVKQRNGAWVWSLVKTYDLMRVQSRLFVIGMPWVVVGVVDINTFAVGGFG
jgi:branched-chain amino acid transport system substrate-binding protein